MNEVQERVLRRTAYELASQFAMNNMRYQVAELMIGRIAISFLKARTIKRAQLSMDAKVLLRKAVVDRLLNNSNEELVDSMLKRMEKDMPALVWDRAMMEARDKAINTPSYHRERAPYARRIYNETLAATLGVAG